MVRKYSRINKNMVEVKRLRALGHKNIVLIGGRIIALEEADDGNKRQTKKT